jgi:hypothetical protein
VSLVIGGDDVSDPVEFSGVSQPIVAIAKKAMKRMLFMSNTLVLRNILCQYTLKKHSKHLICLHIYNNIHSKVLRVSALEIWG